MKFTHILMTSSLIAIAHPAFAHQVPYGSQGQCALTDEDADFSGVPLCTQEEKEKAAATAFCTFTGRPDLDSCAESITNHGMAEAAGKCVDEALQKQVDLKDELTGHKTGGSGGDSAGYWHTEYRYNKENGWHRHDWSEAAREKAGMEYGATAVRTAKDSASTNKTTTDTSTTTSFFGKFLLGIGIKGIANVDTEVGGDHSNTKGTSTERGPLTEKEAKDVYDKAFSQAKADPNLTTVSPNIMCVRDEPKCGSSFSRDIVNDDYQPKAKTTGDTKSGNSNGNGSSGSGSSGSQGGSNNTTPKTSSNDKDIEIDHTPVGNYAGDPNPVTKPGEMIASFDPENLNSPVSKCLLESFTKEVSKDMNKTYNPDGPNLTPEQRKKEAQGLLRSGICNTKYYGHSFCQKHKTMKLTGGQIQDPQGEKSTIFEELQDRSKMNFGNPADFQDRTPIDFSRLPRTSPDAPDSKPIVLPGRK